MIETTLLPDTVTIETSFPSLRSSIENRQATLGVIGLGYVGLPLAVAFAEAGYTVLGFDVDTRAVHGVNEGVSHILDVDSATVTSLAVSRQLSATEDMARLAEADIVSICVPTPLSKTHDPDISYVVAASESVAKTLRRGQLIILESTTYPGTTREVILPRLEATGLRVGEDFFLAFSPERIDPGNPQYGIRNTPKVVGGMDPRSTDLATFFYSQAIDKVVPVSSPETAEMVKLHENTFRAVNIALANETAMICDKLGVDVWEVIQAAVSKPYGFMPFYPGPGVGGHCIPLDPEYLSWKLRTLNYRTRFIELATDINMSMPDHWVGKVNGALNEHGMSVKGSRILILGVAYKADIDDVRESPAFDIIGLLQERGADVSYHDPLVPEIRSARGTMKSVELNRATLRDADCVVVVTNHRRIEMSKVALYSRTVVDTRNALPGRR
jgi:UDP-N-acetyl-D-glucosamine dehydrogenase